MVSQGFEYKAFISYSHAADGEFGRVLERSLEVFAKRWYARRRMRVFRDQTTLALTPELWPTIEQALSHSEFLVLLASPQAAASHWVTQEVEFWLREHGAETILIVLTDGELMWDSQRGAFDPARTDALPQALLGAFDHEPLYADVRWVRSVDQLSDRDARYRDTVATLAAALHGVAKDELVGEDITQHRRQMRLAWGAACALAVLAIGATLAGFLAVQQRNIALERERVAFGRQLALQSAALAREEPNELEQSALLAIESLRAHWNADAQRSLRYALELLPEISDLYGANPWIYQIELSPDEALIAVASDEGAILWATDSGDYRDLHAGTRIREVDFNASGDILVTAGEDGTVRFWNTQTGEELDRIEYPAAVVSVDLSPDDRLVAAGTGEGDSRLYLVDLESGETILEWQGGNDDVREVSFSGNGRYLGAVSSDGPYAVFDRDGSWQKVELERAPVNYSLDLTFSTDEALFAITRGNEAVAWSLSDGRLVRRVIHSDFTGDAKMEFWAWINRVAISPDGALFATAGRDGTARIWDMASGEELVRLAHVGPVTEILFTPDGRRVATSHPAGARLWELPSGQEITRLSFEGTGFGLAMSRNGDWFVSGGPELSVARWREARRDRVATVRHPDDVVRVSCSPDGHRFATADDDHDIRVFDSGGKPVPGLVNLFNPRTLRFSDDGRYLDVHAQVGLHRLTIDGGLQDREIVRDVNELVFGGDQAAVIVHGGAWAIWDLATGQQRPGPGGANVYTPLAMTRDGRFLAATYGDRWANTGAPESIRVWDLADDSLAWEVRQGFQAFDLAIRPDGRALIANAEDRAVLHEADGVTAQELSFAGQLRGAAFVAEGRLAFGLTGTSIPVWNTETGVTTHVLSHNTEVNWVQPSADGRYIASAAGNVISVWDVRSGELISQWSNGGRVSQLCFLQGAQYLVSGDDQGNAIVWRWQQGDLLEQACLALSRNLTRDEWVRYFGDRPYHDTCPGLAEADPDASQPDATRE